MFEALFPSVEDFPLPPPPGWLQPVMMAVCLLSVLLPAGMVRLSSGAIIFGLFFYLQFWTAEMTFEAYMTGNFCMDAIYRWLDLVAIHRPERDFWSVTDVQGEKKEEHVTVEGRAPAGLWEKLKWWTSLWVAKRGVSWNIRSKQLPASVPKDFPKSRWLSKTALRLFFLYLGADLTSNILVYISTNAPFFEQSLAWQVFFVWIEAFRSYYGLELGYSLAAILGVLINFGSPSDWPPISGSFRRDAYTVRKMWGICWHQIMRRPCSEAGRIMNQICGFRKGSFASRYSQIWVAFAVSAGMHHAGATIGRFEDGGYWQGVFFMVQPVAIMGEDFVMWVARKMGIRESVWTKRIGFVWVILWFSCTLRAMVAYRPYSWFQSNPLPSIIEYTASRVK